MKIRATMIGDISFNDPAESPPIKVEIEARIEEIQDAIEQGGQPVPRMMFKEERGIPCGDEDLFVVVAYYRLGWWWVEVEEVDAQV